jgi:hypothetical protein
MKTIILLILSAFTAFAATTYPVLTDNPVRTFSGGGTNLALLNGTNQVFTGTNTFPEAGFFPANNIGMRLLWSSPTNIFLSQLATNAAATNNGDFSATTYIASGTIPPLLGANSTIVMYAIVLRTNGAGNLAAGNGSFFIGPNTNFIGYTPFWSTATPGFNYYSGASTVLQNCNSHTQQVSGQAFSFGKENILTNYFNSSISNTFYLGGWSTGSSTNNLLFGLKLYELYAP